MRNYKKKKYNFLFPACQHFLLQVLQVIVLIVSYTFLLCSSFLCAIIYMFKNRFSYIYIKHLGEIFSFFPPQQFPVDSWILPFYFGTQRLIYIFFMTILLFIFYNPYSDSAQSCSSCSNNTGPDSNVSII